MAFIRGLVTVVVVIVAGSSGCGATTTAKPTERIRIPEARKPPPTANDAILLPVAATCGDGDRDGACDDEDCDDSDRRIHPGAHDPPGDRVDQNCDAYDGVAP